MSTLFTALRALIFGTGFVLFWGWAAWSVRSFDRSFGVALPGWAAPLGIVLMAVGGALALTCVGAFVVRGRGTPAPFDAPREFVAAGPYKRVRNPMYIGGLAVLLGFGLSEGSPSIVIFALLWLVAAHLFVAGYEEPSLQRKFGLTYAQYCRRTPRWLPKL
ncbi:MAG TPA: isoprenylcysteine carboxylmethyltransferase family protein [Bryobacterales bacterium]|nr:isoprenylcysteine carboxylmethyltransferase family protein [Bryobacterales bacterium]